MPKIQPDNEHYTSTSLRTKTKITHEVATAPNNVIKSNYPGSAEDVNQRMNAMDRDIYERIQQRKPSKISEYIMAAIATILVIVGLKAIHK